MEMFVKCDRKSKCHALMLFSLMTYASALNISSQYEPYLRPNSGAVADIVKISIELVSIRQIHENDMEFTADIDIRKYWTDPRLMGAVKRETLFVKHVPTVWVPDLYIVNSANSMHPDDYGRVFRLKSDGQVMLSERMVSQISCSMGFLMFPFDSQVCEMNIKSYGYSTIDLDMVWHGIISQNVPVFNNEYSFVSAEQSSRNDKTSSGEFRSLTLTVTFRRSGIRYLRRTILPTAILAFISYLTLFLQLNKRKYENVGNGVKKQKEIEAQPSTSSGNQVRSETETELNTVQVGLLRLLANGLMVLVFVFVGQINLLNSPSTSTITGLDVWLSIVGLVVFILFIQSLALLLQPIRYQKFGDKLQESFVQKLDRSLLYGIPIFFLVFVVIYFSVYLS